MKKYFYSILFLSLLFLPKFANADVYANLQALDRAAYIAGASIYEKKSTLTTKQSYAVCKIFMLKYNDKLAKGNRKPYFKDFLHDMSPAEITYCWAGYIKTKSPFKIDEVMYLMGKSFFSHNPSLSTRQSYIGCENASVRYNKTLVKKSGNPNLKMFLDYITPAEYTYCWAGYLDAAGQK
ncbi:MAG: hypothetical protein ACYCT6_08935 [bacterium]